MKEKKNFPFSDRFWSEMKTAASRILMIDYDGTIAPFQMNRALAFPYPGIIELLRKINKLNGNQVAIISGRTLFELKNFIHIKGIHLFGSYGMEEEMQGFQENFRISEEEKTILEQGREKIVNAGIEAHLEEKPYSLAFHVRGVKEGDELIKTVFQLWRPLVKSGSISITPFNGGVELTAGKTKDFAIKKMLCNAPLNTFAVYIGDDIPDEPAFKAVNKCGWGIKVGARKNPTSAKLFLKNSQEIISFLKRWVIEQTEK